MFDYDKVTKKLERFDELPEKKQQKNLKRVFCETDFREWFYGVGENKDAQPLNSTMVQRLFNLLARPIVVKSLIDLVNTSDSESFDRTSCALTFLVIDQGIEALNKANSDVTEESKAGSLSNKELRTYREKSELYTDYIGRLLNAIKEKSSHDVKEISKKANLPKSLVYTTYFIVPDRKYIPKYKVSMYMNQILREVYKYTGNNGLDNIEMIRWGNLFGPYFGNEMTTSAAVSVLLEGVKRIEAYQNAVHFNDVRSVWNSLTNFALSELDNAPENIRRQMVELYIKKIDRIYRNGNGPRLRVNLLQIPSEFNNLIGTISKYSERISSITKMNMKPVADFKRRYMDEPIQDDKTDDDDRESEMDRRLEEALNHTRDNRDRNRDNRGRDNRQRNFDFKRDDDEDKPETLIKGVKPEKLMDVDTTSKGYFDSDEDEDDENDAVPPPYFDDED